MPPRILLTGIPSHRIFYAETYADFAIKSGRRRRDIRSFEDILDDARVCGNTGNLLIGEGAAGAFEGQDCTYLPFWYLQSVARKPERLEALRDRFDLLVFATANLLRPNYSADAEADLVEQMGMRTLAMGIGVQDARLLDRLPEGTLRLIRCMAERGHHAMVRGRETEAFLRAHGVENAVATGCPSIFLRPDRMVESIRRLSRIDSFDFECCMLAGYLGQSPPSNDDVRVFSGLSREVHFVLQDEFLHYGLVFDEETEQRRIYDPDSGRIDLDYGHQTGNDRPRRLPEASRPTSVHIFFDNDDWRRWAGRHDIYIGRRFHGGIIAMQAGVPSVFVAVDDRMREMLSWSGLPYIEAADFDRGDKVGVLRAFIDGLDPDAAISTYRHREAHFRKTLARALAAAPVPVSMAS